MSPNDADESQRERLSALLDGELDAVATAAACDHWRCESEARQDWHAWHLIGDVLRSEDLASEGDRDLRFIAVLRERLAVEPVPLAPTWLRRPGIWQAPAALAAGVALVVGAVVATWPQSDPGQQARTDGATGALADLRLASAAGEVAPPPALVALANGSADRQLIRDARLDRYLEAHKQFAGSSALGLPSTFLSGATVDSSAR
ncbi:MAG: sigma-E factor negative regulatory protein [Pseudomonadota bacterium]|nr:sigma-E factor negative regulatory protein [Pseudomonadota bacterium]